MKWNGEGKVFIGIGICEGNANKIKERGLFVKWKG